MNKEKGICTKGVRIRERGTEGRKSEELILTFLFCIFLWQKDVIFVLKKLFL